MIAVVGFVVLRNGGDSTASVRTDETTRPRRTFPTDPPITTAPGTVASTSAPIDPSTTAPSGAVAITGDQLRAAMITVDELDPGWATTSPDNNGDDLCGQFPAKQPITRSAVAFQRTNDAGVDQFLVNEIDVFGSAADADGEFESTLAVVFNCTDGSQVINGIKVKETMTALRANSDVLAGFPGCEKAASVLIHAEAPDVGFNNQANVWYMRCGNTLMSVNLAEPFGSDVAGSSQVVFGAAIASHARIVQLPLDH